MRPIVSVHVPKCSGTSLRIWLFRAIGEESVYLDYEDRPLDPASRMNENIRGFIHARANCTVLPEGKTAVHGHFLAAKYAGVAGAFRMTFLRHPVSRLLSHYLFWKSVPVSSNPIHRRIKSENLSVLQFARIPKIRRIYSNVFFRMADLSGFDFVGEAEDLSNEIDRLGKLLGLDGIKQKTNENPAPEYGRQRQEIENDSSLMSELRSLLSSDIAFYEKYVRR